MTQHPPQLTYIESSSQLKEIVEKSRFKPVLVFNHHSELKESVEKIEELRKNWSIAGEQMDFYVVDGAKSPKLAQDVSAMASIDTEYPQIILFADGVTMYDETGDMISIKKIKLALKIVLRTFKWMESRA